MGGNFNKIHTCRCLRSLYSLLLLTGFFGSLASRGPWWTLLCPLVFVGLLAFKWFSASVFVFYTFLHLFQWLLLICRILEELKYLYSTGIKHLQWVVVISLTLAEAVKLTASSRNEPRLFCARVQVCLEAVDHAAPGNIPAEVLSEAVLVRGGKPG